MNKSQAMESATSTEQRTIRKNFSDDEMNQLRENFAQQEIMKADVEEELAEIKKQFKLKIDALKEAAKEMRTKIKHKYIDRVRDVYCVPNFVSGEMEYYDTESCDLVDSRKLRPNEKQLQIVGEQPSGTNG